MVKQNITTLNYTALSFRYPGWESNPQFCSLGSRQKGCVHTFVLVSGLYIVFWLHQQRKKKVACMSAGASKQWERASIKILPDPPTPPPSGESKGEKEREGGWQAWRRRAVPSPLMFPSSSTRSSGEDNPCVRQCASSAGQSGTAGRSRCFFPNFCSICSLSRTFKNESAHPE